MDSTMYDFEKRHIERAEERARKAEEDRKAADQLNKKARQLSQAIFTYSKKFGTSRQPLPTIDQHTVHLKVAGHPSGAGLQITVHWDGTHDIFEIGGPIRGRLYSNVDKKMVMDRVVDWLMA
jgi:hypothetical protein